MNFPEESRHFPSLADVEVNLALAALQPGDSVSYVSDGDDDASSSLSNKYVSANYESDNSNDDEGYIADDESQGESMDTSQDSEDDEIGKEEDKIVKLGLATLDKMAYLVELCRDSNIKEALQPLCQVNRILRNHFFNRLFQVKTAILDTYETNPIQEV